MNELIFISLLHKKDCRDTSFCKMFPLATLLSHDLGKTLNKTQYIKWNIEKRTNLMLKEVAPWVIIIII